jgi:hypothetical protein
MDGEPADAVSGTIEGRHIVFTRTRQGVFTQTYDGWFFDKNPEGIPFESYLVHPVVAGTITAGFKTQWGWYAWLEEAIIPPR